MKGENNAFLIYQDDNGVSNVNVRFEGEDVWLASEQLAELFQTTQQNISLHVQNIYAEGEMDENRTHKKYLLVRNEGNRSVKRNISHYNLDMILAIGMRNPMRMTDWVTKLDAMLTLSGRQLLTGNGSISHEEACRKAVAEFQEYRRREMIQYESDFDRAVRELTEQGGKPTNGDDSASSAPREA